MADGSGRTIPAGAGDRAASMTLLAVIVATFMVSLDSTAVNVALAHIRDDFHAGLGVQWVVSGYLLGVAAAFPASGWITDRFGARRGVIVGVIVFAAASMVSALSFNLPMLVGARVVQGMAGGPISPMGMAAILRTTPAARTGRAMGLWGLASMMAPALGPTVGGKLIDVISWHWLFAMNIPMAVLSVVLARRHLDPAPSDEVGPLDVVGLVLGATGLSCLLLVLSRGNRWGWSAPLTLVLLVVGSLALGCFVLYELRSAHPALDPRVLRTPQFVSAAAIVSLSFCAMQMRVVFVPLALTDVRGYSAMRIGLMLAPAAFITATVMPLSGRITDRIGPRMPVVIGATASTVGTLLMVLWRTSTNDAVRVGVMAVQGLGVALTGSSCTALALSRVPRAWISMGATWRMLIQQLAGAVTIAGLGGLLEARTPTAPTPAVLQSAHNSLAMVLGMVLVAGIVLATRIPRGTLPHGPVHEGAAPRLSSLPAT